MKWIEINYPKYINRIIPLSAFDQEIVESQSQNQSQNQSENEVEEEEGSLLTSNFDLLFDAFQEISSNYFNDYLSPKIHTVSQQSQKFQQEQLEKFSKDFDAQVNMKNELENEETW